jgi:general secretion pathway protein K
LGDSPEEEGAAYVRFLPGQVYENELPTGRTRYSAVNESGKIGLNTAPRPLLELLLQYLQLDAGEVEMIIDSLMDWRDSDDLHRLQGAESEFYLNLDEPYIPRNGPLQDPAELFLIRGAGTLRDRLVPEDLFTVHNAGGGINFNNLTPALLDFLVEGDRLKEEAYRQALEMHGNLNKDKALEILGEERYELLEQFLSFDSRNPYFTIDSVGIAGDGGEQAEQEQDRAGIRTKVRIRIIGSVVHYLSWMEDHEK